MNEHNDDQMDFMHLEDEAISINNQDNGIAEVRQRPSKISKQSLNPTVYN